MHPAFWNGFEKAAEGVPVFDAGKALKSLRKRRYGLAPGHDEEGNCLPSCDRPEHHREKTAMSSREEIQKRLELLARDRGTTVDAILSKFAAKEHGMMEHKGRTVPREVVSLAHRIEKKEPEYSVGQAHATAWKIYEKHVPEGAAYKLKSGKPKKYEPAEKKASIGKALLAGLLGVGDITSETVARQAGKGIRRATMPVAAAGGTAAIIKHHDKKEEKTATDKAHLALAGISALGAVGSAIGANRAASVREREYRKKYAFWQGFDKEAAVFSIKHPDKAAAMEKLRRLLSIGKK